MKTEMIRRRFLTTVVVIACAFLATTKLNAHVTSGNNCASCHSSTTGVTTVLTSSNTTPPSLSVNPRLDGGSTGNFPSFTAKPGDTVTINLRSTPKTTTGDQFAFAITGRSSSTASGAVSGIKNSTSNKLSFTPTTPSGWTSQSSGSYFTKGPYPWVSGSTATLVLTIGSSTPADVYSIVFRSSGLDSNGKWTQAQEFLLNIQQAGPSVTTGVASALTADGATLSGTVNPNGIATSAYFQYGTTTSYGGTTSSLSLGSGTSAMALSGTLTGLNSATLYHYRAVAVTATGTSLGADATFTTQNPPPIVATGTASAITPEGAVLNGSVNPNGLATTAYYEFGTTLAYGGSTSALSVGSGTNAAAFNATLSGLAPATTYHYRLVAGSLSGTTQGSDQSFTTLPPPPTVLTGTADVVSFQSATLNGSVNPNGVASTCYFKYGLTAAYGNVTSSQNAGSGNSPVAVTGSLSGLAPATTYHFQLVAVSSSGTSSGADQTFVTPNGPPVVTTGSASSITSAGSTLNGSVNPGGLSTTYYFQYGPTASYGNTTSSQSAGGGSSAQSVNASINGLSSSSSYHFQLVAINASGTSFGADQTFTTLPPPPVVTTGSASGITSAAATLSGTVNPNGLPGSAYFQYGTTTGYGSTTASQSTGSGTSGALISTGISGLSASATYHYQLVAVTASGTTFGGDQSFTTPSGPPAATTGTASALTFQSATLNGTVNPNGLDTSFHFEYGTTTGYGTSTATQNAGSGSTTLPSSASISGLSPASTYHFRIVAASTSGTSNGADQTFTTLPLPPVVSTGTAGAVTSETANLNGAVNPNGLAASVYFEYGKTISYGTTTSPQSPASVSGTSPIMASLSGLRGNTTYHFRIIAITLSGTSFGSDRTFTTPASGNANLAGLALSSGTLAPVFNANTLAYACTVPNAVNSIALTPTAANADASITVRVNGGGLIPVVSGSASPGLPLIVGVNTVELKLTAQNGTTLKTYTLAVTRAKNSDATLSDLSLGGASLSPVFASNTLLYSGTLASSVTSVTATQSNDPGAKPIIKVRVNGGAYQPLVSGTPSGPLVLANLGLNTIEVTVTAEDGVTSRTYRLTVARVASANANLAALSISSGQLEPVFDSGTTAYASSAANTIASITLTPVKADSNALIAVRINGAATWSPVVSGKASGPLLLSVGDNSVEVKVTAENGSTTKIYTVGVHRVVAPVTGGAVVNSDQATLDGTVDGRVSRVAFQYGPTTSYGGITPQQIISSGSSSVLVSSSLSGLIPATLYHYRIVATTGAYTDYGPDKTFVTARPYPSPEVAGQGDPAPGIPGPVKFSIFGNPAINSGDPNNSNDPVHWAFQALVSGTMITAKNNSGIWMFTGTGSTLIARTGDAAPGGGVFATLRDPVLNNHDQIAFIGTVSGTNYSSKNNTGIWANNSGALKLIAQTQGAALDASGVKAAAILQAVLPDEAGVIFLANLVSGIGGVTAGNNQGIWAEQNGQLRPLIRKGDLLGGGTVSTLSLLGAPLAPAGVGGQTRSFDSHGNLSFKATFTNGGQGVFVLTSGTVLSQVAVSGSAAPGLFAQPTKIVALNNPILNETGNTAFSALVSGTAKGAPVLPAILAETGSMNLLKVMVVAGDQAPGPNLVSGTFAALGDPVFNSKDQIAFIGKLKPNGIITAASAQGIWASTSGTLALVAQAQTQALDCTAGVKFSAFTQLVLPEQGGVVFLASLVGPNVKSANNQGIWAVDTAGNLRLIARKGDVLLINGTPKVVSSLSIFTSTVGAAGQTRSFNQAGDLIYKLTFTDKTQAIRKVVFP